MKWTANTSSLKPKHFEIKYDPSVGFYLFVFEKNKCIRDYLQDTLEQAKECAYEDFKVPKDIWEVEQ